MTEIKHWYLFGTWKNDLGKDHPDHQSEAENLLDEVVESVRTHCLISIPYAPLERLRTALHSHPDTADVIDAREVLNDVLDNLMGYPVDSYGTDEVLADMRLISDLIATLDKINSRV